VKRIVIFSFLKLPENQSDFFNRISEPKWFPKIEKSFYSMRNQQIVMRKSVKNYFQIIEGKKKEISHPKSFLKNPLFSQAKTSSNQRN